MIKHYGVFEDGRREQMYLSNQSVAFAPLNMSGFSTIQYRLDFTWDNIKYLAIF